MDATKGDPPPGSVKLKGRFLFGLARLLTPRKWHDSINRGQVHYSEFWTPQVLFAWNASSVWTIGQIGIFEPKIAAMLFKSIGAQLWGFVVKIGDGIVFVIRVLRNALTDLLELVLAGS